jgi:hypothetical protein
MARVNTSWNVLPHLPIERLEPNLWRVQGTLRGMALKRVMTLVRLDDGRIAVHSAISLSDDAMAEIEAWGTPAVLLVPNGYHRLDAPAWLERYPDLEVRCPSGARRKVEEVVRVDGTYEDFDVGETLKIDTLDGIAAAEGALIVQSPSGVTLVFNDAVFNMPHGKGMAGWFFRHVTASTGGPRVPRIFRWFVVKDRAALAAHLERLADTPDLVRIIVSHHRMITDRPSETLRAAAADLR